MSDVKHIQGGGFTLARKVFNSPVWHKDPMCLKLWIWIIGRASYKDHEKNGYTYQRGEFVTTYSEIGKALFYTHNRKPIKPTIKKIRIMLQWLESEGMICVNPLKPERCRTGADTTALTRAYVGIKITVINYDTYQDSESYKGRHKGRDLSEQGHNNNKGILKRDKNISIDLYEFYLKEINPEQKTKQRSISNISKHLNKYPLDDLKKSVLNYKPTAISREPQFRKDPANFFGIREKYFVDFLPGNFESSKNESSGSSLLDKYYAANAN